MVKLVRGRLERPERVCSLKTALKRHAHGKLFFLVFDAVWNTSGWYVRAYERGRPPHPYWWRRRDQQKNAPIHTLVDGPFDMQKLALVRARELRRWRCYSHTDCCDEGNEELAVACWAERAPKLSPDAFVNPPWRMEEA